MGGIQLSSSTIAKNTLFLYVRMAFILLVTLYTSRVVLDELGVVDFGIYNVVSGFVVMFSFFGTSMSNAAQRFLNYQYGLGNLNEANNVFNIGLLNFFFMSVLVVLALETTGIWFLNNKLVIPSDRMEIVNIVFHFSVLSVFFTINSYIFRAILIARENMKIYAYTGVFEAVSRLGIAFMLVRTDMDKLLYYSFLYMIVSVIVSVVYMSYCTKNYQECKFKFYWNSILFKQMFSFIGWNTTTNLTEAINQQGISVVLNIFLGPAINAARGIAFQINNALVSFSHNIYMATRPQIVKSYAMENMTFFINTINLSSKFSYYLLLVIAIPLMIKMDFVLSIWLTKVPDYTSIFSILIIVYTLVDSLKNSIWAAAQAVGDLKRYTLIGGGVFLLYFPMSYALMFFGFEPYWVYVAYIVIRIFYLISTVIVINKMIPEFDVHEYLHSVIVPVLLVSLLSPIAPYFVNQYLEGFGGFILVSAVSLVSSLMIIYYIGISAEERDDLKEFIERKYSKPRNINN